MEENERNKKGFGENTKVGGGYAEKTTKIINAESKYLSYSKGLGTIAGVAGTFYSGYKVGNAIGNNKKVNIGDLVDVSIGTIGTISTILLTTPIAITPIAPFLRTIAVGSTIYGGIRVGIDIYIFKKTINI